MRVGLGILLTVGLFALAAPGCGPCVAEEELGTIIYDTRELPGRGKWFEIPDVGQPAAPEPGPADGS